VAVYLISHLVSR